MDRAGLVQKGHGSAAGGECVVPVVVTDEMVDAAYRAWVKTPSANWADWRAAIQAVLLMVSNDPAPIPSADWRTSVEARLSALEAVYAGKLADPVFNGSFEAACRAVEEGKQVSRSSWDANWYLDKRHGEWWLADRRPGKAELRISEKDGLRHAHDWRIVHD
jgi:hypothetical protein